MDYLSEFDEPGTDARPGKRLTGAAAVPYTANDNFLRILHCLDNYI